MKAKEIVEILAKEKVVEKLLSHYFTENKERKEQRYFRCTATGAL